MPNNLNTLLALSLKSLIYTVIFPIVLLMPNITFAEAKLPCICAASKVPISQPNMDTNSVLVWANTAVIAANSYDFINYRKQLQDASTFFTPKGWKSYIAAFKKSNNLSIVIKNKLVVSAVATGAPVLLTSGLISGVFTWKVQMPILITYTSASAKIDKHVIATLLIVRTKPYITKNGLGIAQFIVQVKASPKKKAST